MLYKKSIIKTFLVAVGLLVGFSWQLSAKEMVGFSGKSHEVAKTASDCQGATAQIELNINNVRTRLLAGGDLWWDLSDAKYEVPKVDPESGEASRHSLFAGALWIGGIDALGQLKVAAQTYRQSGNDFYPGPLDASGQTDVSVCSDFDQFWKVEADDINQFLQTFEENGESIPASQVPESLYKWPGRNNPYFVEYHPFDLPSDKDLAPFWDRNSDGEYDPLDGDYPVIDPENEGVFADQMIWWVVNDKGNAHTETGGEAIGLEIKSLAFGFATNDEVNNMTFYKYVVENNSSTSLDSVFFSQWVDPDLGNFQDDYVGCDTLNDLGIVYNGDDFDDDPGYGDNIPVLGIDFFKGPNDEEGKPLGMSSFLYYNNDFTVTGNPETVNHYYGYMAGVWKDGSPFTFGGNGYGGSEPSNYIFPSDPSISAESGGWSECAANNVAADRRFLQTSGAFRLNPGAVNDVIVGVVWVRDGTWLPCSSFRSLLNADRKAQALFDSGFNPIDGPDAPNITIRELDQELVMTLWNGTSSNNYNEAYEEADPVLFSVGIPDSTYSFQGYRIYQLKNSTVTPADFENPSLAREIITVDIKDGIGNIINYTEDPLVGVLVPKLEVEAGDNGIKHTFKISQDKFAEGDDKLINQRRYYFSVIAYAYNGFTPYDPENPSADLNAQQLPYLAGRGNVQVYTAIPHLPGAQFAGQVINAEYGDSPQITQISGEGNGGNDMELTEETVKTIIESGSIDNPVYASGQGPIQVEIFDPTLVPDRKFRVKILNSDIYEIPEKSDRGAILSVNEDGTINYQGPENASYRSDHFNYSIIDGFGNVETASVVLNFDGNLTGFEGAYDDTRVVHAFPNSANNPFEISVLDNDDISVASGVDITSFTNPVAGTLELNQDTKIFTFTPPENAFGTYTWTYTIKDGGKTSTAFVTVYITNAQAEQELNAVDDNIEMGVNYNQVITVLDNDANTLFGGDRVGAGSRWILQDAETNEVLETSQTTIALPNEQAVGGYEAIDGATPLGFTINMAQQPDPGVGNGVITSEVVFEDNTNQWLAFITDAETNSPTNWIRAGQEDDLSNPDLVDYFITNGATTIGAYDGEEYFENILGGGMAPYALANNQANFATELSPTGDFVRDIMQISPGCSDCCPNCTPLDSLTTSATFNAPNPPIPVYDLDDLYSIDLVFTDDKSKWTRCVVVEMGRDRLNNQGGAAKNDIRARKSVDKDGEVLTGLDEEEGRSWFPGYAINVETGQRLNIMFGENTFIGNESGFSRDMLWNPTSEETVIAGSSFNDFFGDYVMGLEHWVYVMDSPYDEGKRYQSLLQQEDFTGKAEVYDEAMWVATPRLAEGAEFTPISEGLIPNEATVRVRVNRPYFPGSEGNCYEFDMGEFAVGQATVSDDVSILDNVTVVPNPYYAFSAYENNKLDNTVKITNLPNQAIVRIFNMSGGLVRQLQVDNRGVDTSISSKTQGSANRNSVDWKLKNSKGIPIASGMYLIHIEAPETGDEKVIKWFGVVRPVDLDTF